MGFVMAPQWVGLVRGKGSPQEKRKSPNRRANGGAVLAEMMQARRCHSVNFDPSRSRLNEYESDRETGQASWDEMVRRANDYRISTVGKGGAAVERALRKDAVIGWALIFNPPMEVSEGWDDETAARFFRDCREVTAEFLPVTADLPHRRARSDGSPCRRCALACGSLALRHGHAALAARTRPWLRVGAPDWRSSLRLRRGRPPRGLVVPGAVTAAARRGGVGTPTLLAAWWEPCSPHTPQRQGPCPRHPARRRPCPLLHLAPRREGCRPLHPQCRPSGRDPQRAQGRRRWAAGQKERRHGVEAMASPTRGDTAPRRVTSTYPRRSIPHISAIFLGS